MKMRKSKKNMRNQQNRHVQVLANQKLVSPQILHMLLQLQEDLKFLKNQMLPKLQPNQKEALKEKKIRVISTKFITGSTIAEMRIVQTKRNELNFKFIDNSYFECFLSLF